MLESPPQSWSEGKPETVYNSKNFTMVEPGDLYSGVKKKWLSFFIFTFNWFDSWGSYLRGIDRSIYKMCKGPHKHFSDSDIAVLRDAEDGKKEDREYVELAIEAAKEVEFSKDVDVIQDTSWVSVELR